MSCSRTTQKSLSYDILILVVLLYVVIIFCWPEGVAYDVAQWLFLVTMDYYGLLWASWRGGDGAACGMPGIPQCTAWWFPWLPGCSRGSEGVCSAPTNVGYTVMLLFLTDCKISGMGRWPSWWTSRSKVPKVINFLLQCLRNKIMALK